MKDIVGVLAVIGGLIEIVAAIGGPQAAGVGMLTGERAPAMETGPLLLGLGIAALSVLGGGLVASGRNGLWWGVALIAAAITGALLVGPWTGFFTMGAAFTLLAGAIALFTRPERRPN